MIGNIVGGFIIYMIIDLILQIIFLAINEYNGDKFRIKIKIPKSKKYCGKIDPIYKLYNPWPNYCDEYYQIEKYSLRYGRSFSFWQFLIPLPLNIQAYKYFKNDFTVYLDEDEYTISQNIKNLKTYYEAKYKSKIIVRNKQKTVDEKIDDLNAEFYDNFC